ncbi:hypothetical protein HELRODRAFT_70479, partial [Helobdella robusta]|uniref:IPT/TIG domain-containing protein n=1 Tax=Helobdella robusta TaxID=6412 RepID=T1G070_HELRO
MNYKLPPPEVTGLSPKMGSKNGGTVVTIRGSNFGESGGELLHVYVCGVDMVKNTKHISSTKLMCTTLPCQPCTGNIVVETKFGGLGSCAVEFSFVEKEK